MQEVQFWVDNAALDTVKNLEIKANFEEMETALTAMVAPYATMVVTADDLKGAKSDRAKLRKVTAAIDDYRKNVKQIYTAPVKAFEDKCKKLTAIIDSGVSNLDAQVKEYEEQAKAAKINGLHEYFNENAGDAAEFLKFEDVFNKQWGNTTFSVEDAQAEITQKISECMTGIETIRNLKSEFEVSLLEEYRATHDIYRVLNKNETLKERKAYEERRKAEAERMRIEREAAAEQARIAAEQAQDKSKESSVIADAIIKETPAEIEEEPLRSVVFRVYGTMTQIMALKEFMQTNGITYGRA